MDVKQQVLHCTTRIEALNESSGITGTGTGFFFSFAATNGRVDGTPFVPAIVTNKHVVEGASAIRIALTKQDVSRQEPILGEFIHIEIADVQSRAVRHPSAHVDLIAIPIAPELQQLDRENSPVFYMTLTVSLLPDDATLTALSALEDVVMVGYPNGLWDAAHNLPILRSGVTATPPGVSHNAKPEFVIDCACFPGSSGSPVFLFNYGSHVGPDGNTYMGRHRILLLGILYAGPVIDATGTVTVETIPTTAISVSSATKVMMNLGYCIQSAELRWFDTTFNDQLRPPAGSSLGSSLIPT